MTKSDRSILSLACTAGAVAAVLFGGAVSTASAAVSLTGLGFAPGTGNTAANSVSADGSVVVGSMQSQAFRWTRDSGAIGLGFLPGGNSSSGRGVSANGSVVVGSGHSTTAPFGEAFRWTGGGLRAKIGSGVCRSDVVSCDAGVGASTRVQSCHRSVPALNAA